MFKPMAIVVLVCVVLAIVHDARDDITKVSYDGTMYPEAIVLYGTEYYDVDSMYVESISVDSVSFVMVTVHGDTTLTEQDFDSVEVCGGFSNSGPVEISYYTIRVENGLGLPLNRYVLWCVVWIPEGERGALLVRDG